MKRYLLIILLLQAFGLYASVPLKKGDVLNVWATQGLPLYNKPETGSKLLSIPYASSVIITDAAVKAQPVTVPLKIGDTKQAFLLKGEWVKIKYNNHEGYVFSGYLSKLACLKRLKLGAEPDEVYLERNYGKPKSTIKKVRSATITTRTYKNGIVQIESANDGCTDAQLYLSGITYQDILLYTQVSLLEADAANNIKISDLKNGKFELSYYACD